MSGKVVTWGKSMLAMGVIKMLGACGPGVPLGTDGEVQEFLATAAVASETSSLVAVHPMATAHYPGLVELNDNSAITVAMNYATDRIFCTRTTESCRIRRPLYAQNSCLLRPGAAEKTQSAAVTLQKRVGKSFKLRLLDCYRPISVQEKMFALVPDPRWVARPDRVRGKFSAHNRGLAVDLTIEHDGKAVDMGSLFDEFSSRALFSYATNSAAMRYKGTLRSVMRHVGFVPYDGEWWHFSVPGRDQALDVPL